MGEGAGAGTVQLVSLSDEQIESLSQGVAEVLFPRLKKYRPKKTMTLDQVCKYLSLSDDSIRRYVKSGSFPAPVKIKGKLQFDRDEIDYWWEQKTEESKQIFKGKNGE
ncbi:MAG: helix-turn-helix domain-containing protein [Endomicrobium sp.]|jgi:excisionase family DNA binding protein|nr:helix-turn-helix domain-containing protein [Endomicrobium sp.]